MVSMAKIKNTTFLTTNADKMYSKRNFYSLLMVIQNGTATLEDSWAVSFKIKHIFNV